MKHIDGSPSSPVSAKACVGVRLKFVAAVYSFVAVWTGWHSSPLILACSTLQGYIAWLSSRPIARYTQIDFCLSLGPRQRDRMLVIVFLGVAGVTVRAE